MLVLAPLGVLAVVAMIIAAIPPRDVMRIHRIRENATQQYEHAGHHEG